MEDELAVTGSDLLQSLRNTELQAPTRPEAIGDLVLLREWIGNTCHSTLENRGSHPVRVDEVTLASTTHDFSPASPAYGESFQMLCHYEGTLGSRETVGGYADMAHYRLPEPEGCFVAYGTLVVDASPGESHLFAFTTCERFSGQVRASASHIEFVLLLEGTVLGPGERVPLEKVLYVQAPNRSAALDILAEQLPPRPGGEARSIPTGWCSWYWYWDEVVEEDVARNVDAIAQRHLPLSLVQVDDGYEAALGDWLIPKEDGGSMAEAAEQWRRRGFEPAIWLAPFIAEASSRVFREHPDWFVRDLSGGPWRSGDNTFAGWRNPPWFVLDVTHPDALRYITDCFRTMRHEWGIRYFKLDALVWGALPWGVRHDPTVTSVQSYRAGMTAIRSAIGADSFLLGCNAPIWPSFGLVDGMRVTGDVDRDWSTFRSLTAEGFGRLWQNGRLWINDPDCFVVKNQGKNVLTTAQFRYHMSYVLAMGGSLFSGDDVARFTEADVAAVTKLLATPGVVARRDPDGVIRGTTRDGRRLEFLFNPTDSTATFDVLEEADDFWTGESAIHPVRVEPMSCVVLERSP
ncbi:glycoside hydrolase family 36 protein [Microbacterium sp. HJ5]